MAQEVGPTATIQEKVTEKIRAQFLDLIPDEVFSAMVKKELADFSEPKRGPYNDSTPKPSPLQEMIQSEIRNRIAASIQAELAKPEYEEKWDPKASRQRPGEIAMMVAKECAPELVAAMFSGMLQMAFQNFKISLREAANRPY